MPTDTPRGSRVSPSKGQAQSILIVDDNRDSADSLARLLRVLGHDVETANDGATALEVAHARPPGIVLLDIGLPGMDGLEIARRMRQEPRLKRTLIVALTGYGMDDDKRRSQEAGLDAHLIKPLDLDELHVLLARSGACAAGAIIPSQPN